MCIMCTVNYWRRNDSSDMHWACWAGVGVAGGGGGGGGGASKLLAHIVLSVNNHVDF